MHQQNRRRGQGIRIAAAIVCAAAQRASAIVSSNSGFDPFHGRNINTLVGANTFYNAGYTGTRSVIANVEGGFIWNQQISLTHVQTFLKSPSGVFDGTQLGQVDWHATMVGAVLGGRLDLFGGEYQRGIAYGANLWSGAIATSWSGTTPTGNWSWSRGEAFLYPYLIAMQTGVGGRRADVINSSWGYTGVPAGDDIFSKVIDGLAAVNGTTVVISAGNEGPASGTVETPGNAFNVISVGALGADIDAVPYNAITSFSSRAPSSFHNALTNVITPNVRATVDLVAPGQNLTLAYYGGLTGGNAGGTDHTGGDTNWYAYNSYGTSFAAPIVAGGAALLDDVGYARFGGGQSVDGRIIKAVLMNSADKTTGWNNGMALSNGVWSTTQSLDYAAGAGKLNLTRAFTQYTTGTDNVPGDVGASIESVGWDFGKVSLGVPNEYTILSTLQGGTTLTATLDWFADRTYDSIAPGGAMSASDHSFSNLNLQLLEIIGGTPTLIAQSISTYNNVEHFAFPLPEDGTYMLRVRWNTEVFELSPKPLTVSYGLAWWATPIPEPGAAMMLASCAMAMTMRRRLDVRRRGRWEQSRRGGRQISIG